MALCECHHVHLEIRNDNVYSYMHSTEVLYHETYFGIYTCSLCLVLIGLLGLESLLGFLSSFFFL